MPSTETVDCSESGYANRHLTNIQNYLSVKFGAQNQRKDVVDVGVSTMGFHGLSVSIYIYIWRHIALLWRRSLYTLFHILCCCTVVLLDYFSGCDIRSIRLVNSLIARPKIINLFGFHCAQCVQCVQCVHDILYMNSFHYMLSRTNELNGHIDNGGLSGSLWNEK